MTDDRDRNDRRSARNRDDGVDWTTAGTPRATAFDDVYYADADGPGETAHVFHAGNDLPRRWAGRSAFAIGELGFGVGLNFFATWALRDAAAPELALDYVSFEIAPPSAQTIRRAMRRWPDLATRAERFLAAMDQWPPAPGWTRATAAPGVVAHLGIGDARSLAPEGWGSTPPAIDAWFLDGFSPAKNPELWSADLFAALASRTAPRGTAASYSSAGWVRRNLSEAGFAVEKRPGFGAKRDMTVARRRG